MYGLIDLCMCIEVLCCAHREIAFPCPRVSVAVKISDEMIGEHKIHVLSQRNKYNDTAIWSTANFVCHFVYSLLCVRETLFIDFFMLTLLLFFPHEKKGPFIIPLYLGMVMLNHMKICIFSFFKPLSFWSFLLATSSTWPVFY